MSLFPYDYDFGHPWRVAAPTCNSAPDAVAPPEAHMASALSSLFDSGKYSDLLIKCRGQKWKVHRAVVGMQSRPIAAALDGGFIEASTGEFDLEDDDPHIVQLMLEYFYKGSLDIEVLAEDTSPTTQSNETSHSDTQYNLYQSRQQYQLGLQPLALAGGIAPAWHNTPAMYPIYPNFASMGMVYQTGMNNSASAYANANFVANSNSSIVYPDSQQASAVSVETTANNLSKNLITSAEVYILADRLDVHPLKVLACDKYKALSNSCWNSEHFIESLSTIFDNTPDTNEKDMLRVAALSAVVAHAKDLLANESFQELCQCRGDITIAVLMATVETPSS
ncbi:hypothetical protein EG329_012403 [Mollisiaceae sp. DMI_Dod_QoI]|nr:hypothetical protein EG329_012403 [Helotiales sp. DMI_Dod_QoI]